MKRSDRFVFIFGLVYLLSRWWMPMDPVAWAPPGDVMLFGGLCTVVLWIRRALAIKEA